MSQPNAERAAVAVEPGALVEWRGGGWAIVKCEGLSMAGAPWLVAGGIDLGPIDNPSACATVLLPAPDRLPGEPRSAERAAAVLDALAGLPGALDSRRAMWPHILLPMESGARLLIGADRIDYKPADGYSDYGGRNYAARGRDWQKEGALRAWLTAALGETQEARDV